MRKAPSGTQWMIESGAHRAVVVEVGGGLRLYNVGDREILDGYAEEEPCPGGAGQVLLPWPNRLRDGRYTFQGTTYQLPLTEPTTHSSLHGLVRFVRWHLVEQHSDRVTVGYDVPPQPGYAWTVRVTTTYAVGEGGLTVTHEAQNLDETPAPFGIGAHPYFMPPGGSVDDVLVSIPARTRLLTDTRALPIGAAKVADSEWDYMAARRLGDAQLDLAFGDVISDEFGRSTVTMSSARGETVRIWADESFRWWQMYTADTQDGDRRRRSIAAEPMTCPPDALRSGRDLIVLEPGQTWRGQWGITV